MHPAWQRQSNFHLQKYFGCRRKIFLTYLPTVVQHSLQLVNIPAREVVAVENLWREITHLSTHLYLVWNVLSSHISFVGEHVSSALVAEDPDVEVDLRHPDQSEGGS